MKFYIKPSLFAQVYSIMAERIGFAIPILYTFVSKKAEETYRQLFELDFELATINAIRLVFPGCMISDCFFYLLKNIKSKLAQEELMR
ncbi:hypothetical protein MXB_801 [Myxobolus squamalis]|nr:hypothetical protein MXB_801 [Myxobolus squamalis]